MHKARKLLAVKTKYARIRTVVKNGIWKVVGCQKEGSRRKNVS